MLLVLEPLGCLTLSLLLELALFLDIFLVLLLEVALLFVHLQFLIDLQQISYRYILFIV